jgi:hypothetical protein
MPGSVLVCPPRDFAMPRKLSRFTRPKYDRRCTPATSTCSQSRSSLSIKRQSLTIKPLSLSNSKSCEGVLEK